MTAPIVCIDRGNTRIKVGVYSGDNENDAQYHAFTQSSELRAFLTDIGPWAAIVAGQSGPWLSELEDLFAETPAWQPGSDCSWPFNIPHTEPERIGIDRLCALAGACFTKNIDSCLVVDAGTCVTYEYLHDGVYLGGAIAPGLTMRLRAMAQGTAALPDVKPDEQFDFPARSTVHNLQAGATLGISMEIEGHIHYFTENFGAAPVFLTGGDALNLVNRLESPIFVAPNLVLDGMYHLYRRRNV